MKRSWILPGLLALPLIFISGCQNSTGLSGDIIGYARLYDVAGVHLSSDSGIVVSVEGTPLKATTAKDGRYVLSGLGTGIYTITYSKTGYGTYKRPGTQFVGGGQAFASLTSLYQLPAFTVTNLVATGTSSITLTGTLSGTLPTGTRYVRVAVGTSADVSADPSKYLFTILFSSSSSTSFSGSLSASTITTGGAVSGQTLYAAAYAEGYLSNAYADFATGKSYYPDVNPTPSNVVTITAP